MKNRTELDRALSEELLRCLPSRLRAELVSLDAPKIDELRLRVGGVCSTVTDGKSHPLDFTLSSGDAAATLKQLCGGSLYAHADTLRSGFLTLGGGIRVGVVGRAVTERDRVVGVYDVQSLCIRIPHVIGGLGEPLCRLLRRGEGVLVYSRPGVGKTTLLRSVIRTLSTGDDPLRVSVIDTRGELSYGLPADCSVDLLSGYPRGEGIEIAARTMNPQLIVCDEIGSSLDEAQSIKAAHNCGVPLLATSHAASLPSLLARSGVELLHKAGIFDVYVGIERGTHDYRYAVTRWRDAH